MFNIENLNKTLEQRVKSVGTGEAMIGLLHKLNEKDELFEYNVSTDIIKNINDDGLMEYLQRVYSQSEFILEDPKDIAIYIKVGSEVIKKGTYKEMLEPDTKGTVTDSSFGDEYVTIRIEDGGVWYVSVADLAVTYKRRRIRRDLNLKDCPSKTGYFKRLKEGDGVIYEGKAIGRERKEGVLIPDGARGRVVWSHSSYSSLFGEPEEGKVDVIWYEQLDLVQKRTHFVRKIFPSWEVCHAPNATEPNKVFTYDDIKLVKPNNVNFGVVWGMLTRDK